MSKIMQIGRPEVYGYEIPEHTITKTIVIYNYFCLKIDCFFAFFRRFADDEMECPKCKERKDVIYKK